MESENESQTTLGVTAFEAIERQLKSLCLKDFPCGQGSWRDDLIVSKSSVKKNGKLKNLTALKKDTAITGSAAADQETVETLRELIITESSPWHLESTWSEEVEKLRALAVKTPWLLNDENVFHHLRTVKIYDQGVVLVDKNLLKLKHLEELILTANRISSVTAHNLPRSLKKLELHANQIMTMDSLCVNPPHLEHLGLGRNLLTSIENHITGSIWPNLVSLDVSHNDLCNLVDVISALETLPKLRHLVMNGNPFSLIPGYRGYAIDTLKQLMVLDDIHLSVDEKLSFQNLSKVQDVITEEALIQIEIPYIKGLPCPDEIKFKDHQPEYPEVDRQYFIQFMFVEEKLKTTSVIISEAVEQLMLIASERNESSVQDVTTDGEAKQLPVVNVEESKKVESAADIAIPSPNEEANKEQGLDVQLTGSINQCSQEFKATPTTNLRLVPVNTKTFTWAPEQTLSITLDLARNNLLQLRDFCRQGMEFSLIEKLVLGYPAGHGHDVKEEKGVKGKGAKSDKKNKKMDKPPSAPKKDRTPQPLETEEPKEVKKKKEEVELVKSDPVLSTLTSFHISLENFLDGEYVCRNTFTAKDLPAPTADIPNDDKNQTKKEKRKDSDSPVDKNRSAKRTPTKDEKKKGKHSLEEHVDLGPQDLELEVVVRLQHWASTKDAEKKINTAHAVITDIISPTI